MQLAACDVKGHKNAGMKDLYAAKVDLLKDRIIFSLEESHRRTSKGARPYPGRRRPKWRMSRASERDLGRLLVE